jgi:outer membrane protein assembly factor BamB
MPSRRALVTALALGVAGCSANPGTPTSSSDTDAPTEADTPTETRTQTPSRTVSHDDGTSSDTPDATGEPPTGPAVQWTLEVGGSVTAQPALADGVLYVAGGRNDSGDPPDNRSIMGTQSAQNLLAVSLDGTERWRYEATAPVGQPVPTSEAVCATVGWSGPYSGIANRIVRVADGTRQWESAPIDSTLTVLATEREAAFVGTSDDALGTSGEELFALESDGSERWRTGAGDAFRATVHDGTLYVPYADQQLVAIDTTVGNQRWSHVGGAAGRAPQVYGDTIYLDTDEQDAQGDYPLLAVDAADGTERWRFTTAGGDDGPFVVTGAVESDEIVYGTEYGGLLFAVDPADGTEHWRYETDGDTTVPPTVVDDTVYLGTGDGMLHAVDATTGDRRWRRSVGTITRGVLANDSAVVARAERGRHSRFVAFSPDGTERWAYDHLESLPLPTLAGQRVYAGTESGFLACFGP